MNYILKSYKKIILWKDTCEFLGPWDPSVRPTPRLMIRPGIAIEINRPWPILCSTNRDSYHFDLLNSIEMDQYLLELCRYVVLNPSGST